MRVIAMTLVGLACAAAARPARADETEADAKDEEAAKPDLDKGSFGVGLVLGEPTGISARLYLKDDQAVQFAAGYAFVTSGLQAHADYCFHPWILQERDMFTLPAYIGPGVRAVLYDGGPDADDYFAIGLRAVAGVVMDFKTVPMDAFLEVAGVVEYAFQEDKGFGFGLNVGAGARYYF